jgi:hypothetical protein
MPNRRKRKSTKKPYEEGSLLHYADSSLSRLQSLSRSSRPTDRLLALDALLFVLVLSVLITHYLVYPDPPFSLGTLVVFAVSLIASLIAGLLYLRILDVILGKKDRVNALRLGMLILLINLPIAVAGLSFSIPLVVKLGAGILGLHFMAILLVAFVSLPIERGSDLETNPSRVWIAVDRLGAIASIVSLLVTVVVLVVGSRT